MVRVFNGKGVPGGVSAFWMRVPAKRRFSGVLKQKMWAGRDAQQASNIGESAYFNCFKAKNYRPVAIVQLFYSDKL